MKFFDDTNTGVILYKELSKSSYTFITGNIWENKTPEAEIRAPLPEILFITSYPPRECGIATYSHDLLNAIQEKFGQSFSLKVCALQAKETAYSYPGEVKYILGASEVEQYHHIADQINSDKNLMYVFIQHEFGLFGDRKSVV